MGKNSRRSPLGFRNHFCGDGSSEISVADADPAALIAAVLTELLPDDQIGVMVLTMTAYNQLAREAGTAETAIFMSFCILCGTRTKRTAAVRQWRGSDAY